MKNIEILQALNKIKLLADSRRLEILRLVMAGPATLTQLARKLNQSPAWIRHHIKTLEEAELVEMIEMLPAMLRPSKPARPPLPEASDPQAAPTKSFPAEDHAGCAAPTAAARPAPGSP